MDDWQQDWLKTFETIANDVGQLFEDMGRDIAEATDALLNFSEEIAEDVEQTLVQIDEAIAPKLDQFDEQMTEWLDPVLQAMFGFGSAIDQAVEPVTHTVEPWLNQHPVCVGCRHYHGQEYGGNMLVCGMHPYGVLDGADSCPDKEAITWSLPNLDHSNSDHEGNDSDSIFF